MSVKDCSDILFSLGEAGKRYSAKPDPDIPFPNLLGIGIVGGTPKKKNKSKSANFTD
jgi:hypothetical protein